METMELSIMAQKYLQILTQMSGLNISWKLAQKIVGGKKRLERLMLEERVRYSKPEGAPNTKWQFNACDIFKNVKPNPRRLNKIKAGKCCI